MTEINPAGWFQNRADHNASQLRMYHGGVLDQHLQFGETNAFGPPLGGVHPVRRMWVHTTDPVSMNVVVGPGIAYIPGTEAPTQGTYVCVNDGDVTLPIGASHASLTRIDLVIARVHDAQYSGGTNAWALEVVVGTPGGTAPSVPDNSLVLAQITIGPTVTTITDNDISELVKRYISGVGGFQAWPSQAEVESSSLTGADFATFFDGLPIPVPYLDLNAYDDTAFARRMMYKYYDGIYSRAFLTTENAGMGLYAGVIYQGSAVLASSTTTEQPIPTLTLPQATATNPVNVGSIWMGKVRCFVRSTVAADRATFRIRTDPLGGIIVEEYTDFYIPVANVLFPVEFDYVASPSTQPGDLFLSVQRAAGTGNVQVVGKGTVGLQRGLSWHLLYHEFNSSDVAFTS